MKIVIDMPENGYEVLKNKADKSVLECIVLNGTVLPKGHGRLIDADLLLNHSDGGDWDGVGFGPEYVRVKYIYNASTIIEADKEEEE